MTSPVDGGELAHALRNPLSSVKIVLQAVNRDGPAVHARRARLALREVRKMERLLSVLAECGSPPHMARRPCELAELVARSVADVTEELEQREATVETCGGEGLKPVGCDAVRVRPLLAQLLLETADRCQASGTLKVVIEACEDGGRLSLPFGEAPRSSTSELCVQGLAAMLQPAGGSALWTGAGVGTVELRFPWPG